MTRDPRLLGYAEKKFLRKVKEPKPLKAEKRKGDAEGEGFEPEYLAWIRKQPCIITGLRTGERFTVPGTVGKQKFARIVAAHMKAGRTKGTDATALPVEETYHNAGQPLGQHDMGIVSWARHHTLDIPALIAVHRKRYALEMATKSRTT